MNRDLKFYNNGKEHHKCVEWNCSNDAIFDGVDSKTGEVFPFCVLHGLRFVSRLLRIDLRRAREDRYIEMGYR